MKLELNREYASRHLFFVILMLALGGWFGYDGLISYPSQPAAELYRRIEGSEPSERTDLEAFKQQKIHTQYGFTLMALIAAAVVGFRLYRSRQFDFSFDDTGFSHNGKHTTFKDIGSVDRSRWAKKSILVVDGLTLDGWHHQGVDAFEKLLAERGL